MVAATSFHLSNYSVIVLTPVDATCLYNILREREKKCVCVRVFVYTIMVRQSKRKRVSTIQSNRTVPVINIKTFTGPDQQTPTLKHGDDGDLSNCLEVGL